MIALLLALQAASAVDGTPLGALPRQELPASGCAAYLWSAEPTRRLIAMAVASPARLRVSLDGKMIDLPLASGEGTGGYGFAGMTRYALGDVTATVDMTIETSSSLTQGATVPRGALSIERRGRDGLVVPVAGLIGCAA